MARAAILIGIIAFVFVGVLPGLVDYDAVRAALASLTAAQLAVLVAATGSPTSRTPGPAGCWWTGCPGRTPSAPTSPPEPS